MNIIELSSYGSITKGIAHEIRNPLGMILSAAEIIEDSNGDKDLISTWTKNIKDCVLRLNKITTAMLNYTINKRKVKKNILNYVIEDILQLCQSTIKKKRIDLDYEINQKNIEIFFDEDNLNQLLMQLILNAVEAVEFNGKIKIRVLQEDRYCLIKILDNGPGIAKTEHAKIFEPFYTTKSKHIGLGLAICKNILNQNEGEIFLTSDLGEGACFNVKIKTDYDFKT